MTFQTANWAENEATTPLLGSVASEKSQQALSKKALVADEEKKVAETTNEETAQASTCEISLL
jgi:hypothetical protein